MLNHRETAALVSAIMHCGQFSNLVEKLDVIDLLRAYVEPGIQIVPRDGEIDIVKKEGVKAESAPQGKKDA